MCQKMSNPDRQSMVNLGRVVRYLKRETQQGEAFSYGRMAEEVTKFTDSDWTGCIETRKSSSAAVILLGNHALRAYTRKQKTIAKSSAEAELCAAALGASESKDIVSLLNDLDYEMKPVLAIDSRATEHILHRQGIGKLKHIDAAYLWIRDEIRSKRLRVRRVRSEEHVADLGIKPLGKSVIAKHCLTLGNVNMAKGDGQRKQGVVMSLGFGWTQVFVTGV